MAQTTPYIFAHNEDEKSPIEQLTIGGPRGLFRRYIAECTIEGTPYWRIHQQKIGAFEEWLSQKKGVVPEKLVLGDITRARIQEFLNHIVSTWTTGTGNAYFAVIKGFTKFVKSHFPLYVNPADYVSYFPRVKRVPKGIPQEVIQALIDAAYQTGTSMFVRMRSGTIAELAAATGLRIDELRMLTLSQLSPDRAWLRNVICKNKMTRNVFIAEDLRPKLEEWLYLRDLKLRETKSSYAGLSDKQKGAIALFPTLHRARPKDPTSFFMHPNSMLQTFRDISEKAQTDTRYTCHRYRHAFAHHLLDVSKDIRLVQQALGHADISTTMTYTEREDEVIGEAMEQAWKRRGIRT